MATNTPIGQGKIITADQFNELLSVYNTHWSDDIPSATFSDLTQETRDLHSRGWGMPNVVPPVVDCNTIIQSVHINELIAQVNAGSLHRNQTHPDDPDVNLFEPYPKYSPTSSELAKKSPVYASIYSQLNSYMNDLKSNTLVNIGTAFESLPTEFNMYDINEYPRFLLNPDHAFYATSERIITNNPTWNSGENDNSIFTEFKSTFSSYTEARYFFNSGGKIILELDSRGGFGTNYWDYILGGIGQIRIGALNVLLPNFQVNITPMSLGGFYNMNDNGLENWSTVFQATGTKVGEYGYGEYGDGEYYGVGEYAARTVKLELRGMENPDGTFSLHTRVILSDNITLNKILTSDFIADVGYLRPVDAPTDGPDPADNWFNDSRGDPYTVYNENCDPNTTPTIKSQYQFTEREAPTIEIVSNWQVYT
jgi:hypothetical protein